MISHLTCLLSSARICTACWKWTLVLLYFVCLQILPITLLLTHPYFQTFLRPWCVCNASVHSNTQTWNWHFIDLFLVPYNIIYKIRYVLTKVAILTNYFTLISNTGIIFLFIENVYFSCTYCDVWMNFSFSKLCIYAVNSGKQNQNNLILNNRSLQS